MANERKTENIVRSILNKNKTAYETETKGFVYIEEQKSDNPNIQKLLMSASKKGGGIGKPEFIVSFKGNNLIIVIECKADTRKHRSKTLDKYKDYAVDGAILYSSYLSKDYDVIAIGVSGENEKELLVDTFLQIKGESKPKQLKINSFYKFDNYIDILHSDSTKERNNYEELIVFSKTLNNYLRDTFEFEENQRPLIVSGILLALEDDGFCASYTKKQKPDEIANLLITTIKERLSRDNIDIARSKTLIEIYNFIKTNTNIITEKNKDGSPNANLINLIREIETKAKPFLNNYKHYDVIGQFYNEFLRYANGDGGLGIVLTPRHVTNIFTTLAEINKDSVVLDNCCGTGGFLISSMKQMERLANSDKQKINKIHEKQLIGIENNPKMFCLACSNMMLRGDGKSNIYQQDCFNIDEKIIKQFKPTVGLLNPPYSKQKKDYRELSFIENCLNMLEPQGICVAIIPQSCVMNTDKTNLILKNRILGSHTLKAVMSMPDTLFEDSDKNAITCILVFVAHRPHNSNIKTWFGYWKEDGFIKVRPYGRIDYYNKFKDKIRNLWVNSYFAQKEIPGFSVLKGVTGNDEWLVEPYLKTKFENITDEYFENTLKEYSTFLFYNKLSDRVTSEQYNKKHLKLDFNKWKYIKLSDLFDVVGSKTTDKKILDEQHSKSKVYPYLSTQATNNGVRGFYEIFTDEGNILTIDSATIGYCTYQPLNFSASDHVEKLQPKFTLNVYRGLFLSTIINMEQYRYSYGRKFNQDRINETRIKLPFKKNAVDWIYIENYIKGLRYSKYINLKKKN